MTDVLLYVLGIAIIVIGLALSIALHELGHLIPAKLFGVRVTQYMIGFGTTLWSRRRGETEYGLKLIPLGGYVAMAGMYPPQKPGGAAREASTGFLNTMVQEGRDASARTIVRDSEHRTFYQLPMWKKIVVMLGGPFMNLVLAFVFFGIVLMGFGVAQYSTTVQAVSECLVPADSDATECAPGDPLAPGAAAGLAPGDRIVAIDGAQISSWQQVRDTISDAPGTQLSITVERMSADGESITETLAVTPASNERWVSDDRGELVTDDAGEPLIETVGMIGVSPGVENVRQPITEVPGFLGENIARVTGVIISLPERMIDVWNAAFGPDERDPNGPISVVGVGRIAGEITSMDEVPVAARAQTLIGLLGSLNVALFVFNLVPLMPLDGGHIAGALYEGLKRGWARLRGTEDPGPVDTAKMIPVTFVVVVLLGAMTVMLVYADIVKPVALFG